MVIEAHGRGQSLQILLKHRSHCLQIHVNPKRARTGPGMQTAGTGQRFHGQMHKAVQTLLHGQGSGEGRRGRARPDGEGHGKGQSRQCFGRLQALSQIVDHQNQSRAGQGSAQIAQCRFPTWKTEDMRHAVIQADFQRALLCPKHLRPRSRGCFACR